MKFKNIPIKKAEEIKNCAWVYLSIDDIIIIDWFKSLKEIKTHHIKEIVNTVGELGNEAKLPVFTMTFDFISISAEAKEYTASPEAEKYSLANAVLIDNLAKALVFNFYLKLNKPTVPTKAFTKIEDGLAWLNACKVNAKQIKEEEIIA